MAELIPVHLIILATVVCILIFLIAPAIDWAIGARDPIAKKSRRARLIKAAILVSFPIIIALLPLNGYIVDSVEVIFPIAAVVFLVKGIATRRQVVVALK
jgi:hypothetical protein